MMMRIMIIVIKKIIIMLGRGSNDTNDQDKETR